MIKGMVYMKEKNSYYSLLHLDFKRMVATVDKKYGGKEVSFGEISNIFLVTEKTVTISRQ